VIPSSDFITTDGWHTEHPLRPVFMGCSTKNAKVTTVALDSRISQGVDIQLKILQTLLSLITDFPAIHGRLLANVRAFIMCFLFSYLADR
jgi:hypothetical protein